MLGLGLSIRLHNEHGQLLGGDLVEPDEVLEDILDRLARDLFFIQLIAHQGADIEHCECFFTPIPHDDSPDKRKE
ncbi:hypothetical protein D3C84_1055140 [compost metagenome]